jgi:hypothetical protein
MFYSDTGNKSSAMKLPNIFEVLTIALVALIAFSWVYVAFNGRGSGPSSWGEYYESAGR